MTRRASRWALPSAAAVALSALASLASAFMTPCPSSSGGGGGATARVGSGGDSPLGQRGCCSGAAGRLGEVSQRAVDRRHRHRHHLRSGQVVGGSGARHRGSGGAMSMLDTVVEGQSHAYEVVFVRHGQSTWNKANRFIGWTDAELTEEGEIEARVAGQVRQTAVAACVAFFSKHVSTEVSETDMYIMTYTNSNSSSRTSVCSGATPPCHTAVLLLLYVLFLVVACFARGVDVCPRCAAGGNKVRARTRTSRTRTPCVVIRGRISGKCSINTSNVRTCSSSVVRTRTNFCTRV